jgi:hypothetical protein
MGRTSPVQHTEHVDAIPALAQRALSAVLEPGPSVAIVDSWTEGNDVICLTYRNGPGRLAGLRRQSEPDVPLDEVVQEIVYLELEEPRGTRGMTQGPDGVMWWSGNPESDRTYNLGKSPSRWERFARPFTTS